MIRSDLAGGEIGIEAIDGLEEHRVPEAIYRVRELGDDGRVDRRIVPFWGKECVDLRLDFAGELLEHQVLVLHLGGEFRRLEQALAIPHAGRQLPLGDKSSIAAGQNRCP